MIYKPFYRRTGGGLLASIAIHIVAILALVQIVFRYPLGQLIGIPEPEPIRERVQFVKLPPPKPENSGGGHTAEPIKGSAPAPIPTPTITPSTVPIAHPSDSSRAHAAGGTGTGLGVSGSELATGIEPRQPDRRIALEVGPIAKTPRSVAEDVDSIVNLAIGVYNDSIGLYARQRKPGDWTIKGKNGSTWGVDDKYIYIGKWKLPSALLALLPLNASSPQSPIEARSAAYIHRDVIEGAQRAISEDEFKAAIKRIRERKEREKRQALLVDQSKDPKDSKSP